MQQTEQQAHDYRSESAFNAHMRILPAAGYFATFLDLDDLDRADERGEDVSPARLFTGEPPRVQVAVPSLEDRIAERVTEMVIARLTEEGFIKAYSRRSAPVPTPPRSVPTPPARELSDSPRAIIERIAGERLYLRSLWYQPTAALRPRWEGVADDGEDGEHPHIKIWIWEEDKKKLTDAGYSERLFEKTVTRLMLQEAIPITVKWTDSGTKLDEVVKQIEVKRRSA